MQQLSLFGFDDVPAEKMSEPLTAKKVDEPVLHTKQTAKETPPKRESKLQQHSLFPDLFSNAETTTNVTEEEVPDVPSLQQDAPPQPLDIVAVEQQNDEWPLSMQDAEPVVAFAEEEKNVVAENVPTQEDALLQTNNEAEIVIVADAVKVKEESIAIKEQSSGLLFEEESAKSTTKAASATVVTKKRGRKSFKEIDAEVDLISVPEDEELFQKQYYSISTVAKWFRVNTSLLRFWENEFDILKPRKNRKGDRLFRPEDVKNLRVIYYLLRQRKFTIDGAKKYLKANKKTVDTNLQLIESLTKVKSFLLELRAHL